MKRVFLFACLALGSAIVGCGGGGGLDSKKQLSALDDAEAKELCSDATVVTKDCGGIKVTTKNAAECELNVKSLSETCTATVADYDACDAADPCAKLTNTACAKIGACSTAQ